MTNSNFPQNIKEVEKPIQLQDSQFRVNLTEAGGLIRAPEARHKYSVTGKGLTVAVIDTGLRTTHIDFEGRVVEQYNFTSDNNNNPNDASDGNGHGTNVAGIIAANRKHIGIAPNCQVIPLKALSNNGRGNFEAVEKSLEWIIQNHSVHNITAVCMSLGDGENHTVDTEFEMHEIRSKIQILTDKKIAVVVASGNEFFRFSSQQGMSKPAIFRETISVGAVYDARVGPFYYSNGASTFESAPDRITPFSQRLHETINPMTRTDIFAPGAAITSSGISNDQAESIQRGTSQAAPMIAGVVLLLQEYYQNLTGSLPSVDDLKIYLRSGGVIINDGDDEKDNVDNTNLDFIRADVVGALENINKRLTKTIIEEQKPLKEIFNK